MSKRNDRLLLALGWIQVNPDPSGWPYTWVDPSGEAYDLSDTPRPYDSVDDGLAICKERGWQVTADWFDPTSENSVSLWVQVGGWPEKMGVVVGGEPAEALSEAILKALARKENSHD